MINYDKIIDMIPTIMKDSTLKYASKSIRTKNYHTKAIVNYMKSRNWNMEGFYLYYSNSDHEIYFVYSMDVSKFRITETLSMRDGTVVDLVFADNIFNKNKTDGNLLDNMNQAIYEVESDFNHSHILTLYAIDHCLHDYLDREARELIENEREDSAIFDKYNKENVLNFIDEYMESDDKKDFILSIIESKDYNYLDRADVIYDMISNH